MLSSVNILSYRSTDDHKRSFELLVDNQPIRKFANSSASSIPSRLFKNGLALLPVDHLDNATKKRIVAVCSCGEWGCGSIRCDVSKSWDENIIFRDFTIDPLHSKPTSNMLMFSFSAANYDSVISEILHEIEEFEIA